MKFPEDAGAAGASVPRWHVGSFSLAEMAGSRFSDGPFFLHNLNENGDDLEAKQPHFRLARRARR
jgi:hypothetical protein